MSSRHHYIPQWYLKGFCTKDIPAGQEPFLWVRTLGETLANSVTSRRAPKNVAAKAGYYDCEGPDKDEFEQVLSSMESHAAFSLRQFLERPIGSRGDIPNDVFIFIAWLAARTPQMLRVLSERWDKLLLSTKWGENGFPSATDFFVTLQHVESGEMLDEPVASVTSLLESREWRVIPTQQQRVDFIRIQARLFATEHFPDYRWIILAAPPGTSFVVSDRPVVWCVPGEGYTDLPGALKHPRAEVTVPLDTSNALLGLPSNRPVPSRVEPWEINIRTAAFAERFVAGSDQATIEEVFERVVATVVSAMDHLSARMKERPQK